MTDGFSGDDLRDVMRHVASPVTVVTFPSVDGPRGVTIGSFASVSLDPPLISFNVSRESAAHDALVDVDRFNVNILSAEQAYVASHFALSGLSSRQQFDPVAFELDDNGIARILGCVSTMTCRRMDSLKAGDSTVVVASVEAATMPASDGPLLYFRQLYHGVGQPVVDQLDAETNRVSSSTP